LKLNLISCAEVENIWINCVEICGDRVCIMYSNQSLTICWVLALPFFFCSIGDCTQVLVHARQVHYYFSHIPSLFSLSFFQVGSCLCLRLALDHGPPASPFCVSDIIDMCYYTGPFLLF
jgi:hypothetical protein